MNSNSLVSMKNISKSFGSIEALKNTNFDLNKGEIVGLAGDNGAGKSTLVKILAGVFPYDSGEIFLEGNEIKLSSPKEAIQLGIESIYQDLALFEDMDLSRNIFIGREPVKNKLGGLIKNLDKETMNQETLSALKMIKINITDTSQLVHTLSGGQRQSVAVARAVYFRAKIVIMDEPTAALSVKEVQKILDLALQLKAEGIGVIIITHNLHHMFSVADRITVLQHGALVGNKKIKDTNIKEIENLIIGAHEKD
jgi:ABC-type sugar transport system ATPase subunit